MKLFFFLFLAFSSLSAHMIHTENVAKEWREENLAPFDEFILTWNAKRPKEGKYSFYVSIKHDEWSPELLYATWESGRQLSNIAKTEDKVIQTYQDTIDVKNGKKGTGFQIRIVAENNADLASIDSLHVYINSDAKEEVVQKTDYQDSIYLKVPGLSQMTLDHPRHRDLCSPTSTTAVLRYLTEDLSIDPIVQATCSWDKGSDIFGNWVFNVSQAYTHLDKNWMTWVERLQGFDAIYQKLQKGTPVVVSVRGPLKGSAQPYKGGHLIAVIGYDAKEKKVICMDPAFPSDKETHVRYDLDDFLAAWSRRGNIAYIFVKKT